MRDVCDEIDTERFQFMQIGQVRNYHEETGSILPDNHGASDVEYQLVAVTGKDQFLFNFFTFFKCILNHLNELRGTSPIDVKRWGGLLNPEKMVRGVVMAEDFAIPVNDEDGFPHGLIDQFPLRIFMGDVF